MSITGLEGSSFAGKSTLAETLARIHDYRVIYEPSYYVDHFPSPPDDAADAKRNFRFFADVEQERSADARQVEIKYGKVIMDRTLWTYIHYEYCVMKRTPDRPNAFEYGIDYLQRLAERGNVIVPPILIALTPGSEEIFKHRVAERGQVGISFLNEWDTTILVDQVLSTVLGVYPHGYGNRWVTDRDVTSIAEEVDSMISLASPNAEIDIALIFDALRNLAR